LNAISPPQSAAPFSAEVNSVLEDGRGVHLHTEGSCELGEQSDPRVQLAGAVVAVHHRHQVPGRRGDQIELAVDPAELALENDHREDARAGADVPCARGDRVGRHHARSSVAFRRAHRNASTQPAGRVEQLRARRGELAAHLPRMPDRGQQIGQPHIQPRFTRELVELVQHPGVVTTRCDVDREHAAGVTDAQHLLPRSAANGRSRPMLSDA
jgi:hypothetical protein